MPFNAGDIESSLELDRSPFNRGLTQARADAKRFEDDKIKATVDLDRSKLDELNKSRARTITIPAEVDTKRLAQQLERIGDNTETTARRSGNQFARALLNPVVIQLGLLPGIAAASAAASGIAMTAAVAGFAALGAVAIKDNEQVKQSFKSLWEEAKNDTKQAAAGLAPYGVEIARELWSGLKTIQPQLHGIFVSLGPEVLDLTKSLTHMAENAMPGIERSIRNAGPAVHGFGQLLEQTGTGVGQFFEQVSSRSSETGRGLNTLGYIIQTLLNNLGRLAASFSVAWDRIGPVVSRVLDKMLDGINNLVSGGIPAFTGSLNVTLHVLQAVLDVLGPFADILGGGAGWILGSVASFKLLAGSIGLVAKAASLVNPATLAGKMTGFTKSIETAAMATGGFVTKVSGMPMAGAQAANLFRSVGNAAVSAAKYIPLVGVGVAGITAAVDHFFPSADELAASLARGGKEAEEASHKVYDVAGGYSKWNIVAGIFGSKQDEVAAALRRHRESLTDLERAQEDVTKAQRDYQYAVDKFGAGSDQAIAAQQHLAAVTKGVEDAQLRAAQATQTNTDKIVFQTNLLLGSVGARLNYQNSLLQLEQAHKDAATATAQHGAKSLEARQANLQYQQSLLSVVTSLGDRVKAENADKSETEQNRLATFAMHQEIARLAVIAGKDAPPALQQLAGSLSDAELAAMGVHKEVDKTGKAIYTLPPGKTLSFPSDAPITQKQVESLHTAINNLPPSKNFNYILNVVTGKSESLPGFVTGLPGRAEGGPVKRGMAYWVGERGVPELFFPDVDGFVLNGGDSQRAVSAQTGAQASPVPLSAAGSLDPEQLVGLMVAAIVRAFAQLRLRVDGQEWARLVNNTNIANERR
jgi:hypothetical protein